MALPEEEAVIKVINLLLQVMQNKKIKSFKKNRQEPNLRGDKEKHRTNHQTVM
jgi:hypothetical protein